MKATHPHRKVILRPARVGLLRRPADKKYTVHEAHNTLNPRVREVLTEPEVQALIDDGTHVVIVEE